MSVLGDSGEKLFGLPDSDLESSHNITPHVPWLTSGEKLGGQLVESRLAACVNIIPGVTSIYSWKGEVQKDQELLLIIKTKR